MFHQSILAGMIGNDRQSAAWLERVPESGQRTLQSTQFIIDCDAQSLEKTGKLRWPGARAQSRPDGVHEVIAGYEFRLIPASRDLRSKPASLPLIAVVPKNGFQ